MNSKVCKFWPLRGFAGAVKVILVLGFEKELWKQGSMDRNDCRYADSLGSDVHNCMIIMQIRR